MNTTARCELASWCLAGAALLIVLKLHLLAALLAGLLAHELIHGAAHGLQITGTSLRVRKFIVLLLMIAVIALLATGAGIGVAALTARGPDSLIALLQIMADLIETARTRLPEWVQAYVPSTAEELQSAASGWLRDHAGELKTAGENVGRGLIHVVVGILIGSLMAFTPLTAATEAPPLVRALKARAAILSHSFRRFAFAQVRISALNTTLTTIYLAVVLPLCGVHLPLVKTVIAVTFFVGLLPLVGNLITNTVIVVVSLSASLGAAVGSLIFLITIHKLEYLVNARIIGTEIRARTWELLLAMLVMESVFGLPGLIAAPIYYSYLKDELSAKGLV
jgi:predicted PurR-regulated permease PerM